MSQLLLSRSPYRSELLASSVGAIRRARAVPMKMKFEFGPMTLIVGLILLAIGMSLLYLMHFNQVATKGYDLQRLQADRQTLMDQNQISNMSIDKVKSMSSIFASSRIQTMHKANDIIFVRGDSAMAKVGIGS